MLSHDVYFTLNDSSPEAIDRLVRACHQYLKRLDGITFFAVGTLVKELQRPVNDHEFDVAVHVVFTDKAAHDAYQTSADHLAFIAEQKPNWKQCRVFDSYVES